MVRALYSHEGITWTEIGIHWLPDNFQVNGVGIQAAQDFFTPDWDIPADFDYFEMTEGWGFLPEGFHDYDSGDVPNWNCFSICARAAASALPFSEDAPLRDLSSMGYPC